MNEHSSTEVGLGKILSYDGHKCRVRLMTGEEIDAVIPTTTIRRIGFLPGNLQGWQAHLRISNSSKPSRIFDLNPPK